MVLRNSEHKGDANYRFIHSLAQGAMGEDKEGYRKEFLQLVRYGCAHQQRKRNGGRNEERYKLCIT
jgi:hypothetical protein